MRVIDLEIKDYRNLNHDHIKPSEGINIIYGDNAQGKTNILEAIWLFTGGRSFRGAKDRDLVRFDQKAAKLNMNFYAAGREQNQEITITSGKRSFKLNGVEKPGAASIVGTFCAIIFSPAHLSLVKEGPSERRRFIDAAICQIKPSYPSLLSSYNHILNQRNTLLKNIPHHAELLDTLDIWEQKLASYGAMITVERLKYVSHLKKFSSSVYEGICQGKEKIEVEYKSHFCEDGCNGLEIITKNLENKLYNSRKEDINLGFTSLGPHRDDLNIKIDQKSAKLFGSQGQQRSCVLALKLSEAAILKEFTDEKPVVLLDDVMSELDNFRQDYILNCINGWQVFITCCEPSTIVRLTNGQKFYVQNGHCTAK